MPNEQPQPSLFASVITPCIYVLGIMDVATILFWLDIPLYNAIIAAHLQTTPLGNSAPAQISFVTLYLLASAITVFVLAALVVRRRLTDRRWLVVATIFGFLTFMTAQGVFWYIPIYLVLMAVVVLWVLFVLAAAGKVHRLAGIPFVITLITTAAVILVLVLPVLSLVALVSAFAVWDIFAVLKSKVMVRLATGLPPKLGKLFMLRVGARNIGYGDLLFWSVITVLGDTFNTLSAVLAYGGILTGVYLTFLLLRSGKYRALPGLPIPIVLGLLGIGVGLIV